MSVWTPSVTAFGYSFHISKLKGDNIECIKNIFSLLKQSNISILKTILFSGFGK